MLLGILFMLIWMAIWLGIAVLMIVGMWKVFVKAGKPGWASIIPIYNMIVLTEIAGKPLPWFILACIPFVNLLVYIPFAEKFGKTAGFAVGMLFLPFIFFPMLGFGSAQYGGAGQPAQGFQPVMPQ